MRKVYPKYHPPIDWPYAEVPNTHAYRVAPAPGQRLRNKDRLMAGATFQPVPFAYEDPYLVSAQNIVYQADTSHMHRYPYIRPGEDLGRPDMFDEPFPTGSANYMDAYGSEDEFGKIEWGKLKEKVQSGFDKNPELAKQAGGLLSRLSAGKAKRKSKRASRRSAKSGAPARGISFLADVNKAITQTSQAAGANIPEPGMTSNLFSQVAENEKVSIASRLQVAPQLPLIINQSPIALLEENELTIRSGEIQTSEDALKKSKSKNRMLLYTTIAVGGLASILGITIAFSPKRKNN